MPEEDMIRQCSPTLAGIKTGSLFSVKYESEEEMKDDVRYWNRTMVPKGVRVLPMSYKNGRALIYIYRPGKLKGDLMNPTAEKLLSKCGYPCENADYCVVCLARRLQEKANFPHEIGLFLGYPPDDVEGFINNRAAESKCVGYWKVYSDEERAKRLFNQYSKCIRVYSDQYAKGRTIDQLTISTAV